MLAGWRICGCVDVTVYRLCITLADMYRAVYVMVVGSCIDVMGIDCGSVTTRVHRCVLTGYPVCSMILDGQTLSCPRWCDR